MRAPRQRDLFRFNSTISNLTVKLSELVMVTSNFGGIFIIIINLLILNAQQETTEVSTFIKTHHGLINNTCVSIIESITTKCLQEHKFIRAMGISNCNHREDIYQDTSKHQEYTLIITYDGAKCDSNKKENFMLIVNDKICKVVHYEESYKFYKKWVITPLSWSTWSVVALFILAVCYTIYSKLLRDRIIKICRMIVVRIM
ncbi:hypothetical protein TSAR_010833, partial [Trichomalopsis sarcophagae]